MKIAYMLPSSMISGGGKVILQQAEELGRRGHRVTVVCPDAPPEWFTLRHARFERAPFGSSSAIPEADVTVATFWTTIEPAVAAAAGSLFHLCQGIESDSAYYSGDSAAIESAYRRIPRKIVVSSHLRGFLESRGYADVRDVGQSFDAADFRFEGRRFDRKLLRVFVPGVFEIDLKGVGEALEGLRRLRGRGGTFRLFRASPEPMSPAEKKFKVVDEYHRAVSPRRIPALLAHVDIFVGPNHEAEGFGLPTLEALAAGLPAALSETPSHRAMAGDCAVFFAPRDPESLASAVGRLLDEPETRRRLSADGPIRAARFRTSDVGERLERAFESAGAA